MAHHTTPEEKQLIKLIAKMPIAEEERKIYAERIQAEGFSEVLSDELREKIVAIEDGSDRTRWLNDFSQHIHQCRLAQQRHNFRRM